MRLRTTSTQRTYRYVRLSIVGATLVLAVSIGLEVAGRGALSSLSAAFYTPAGHLFVGSLCAIALALLLPGFGNHGLWAALMVLNATRGITLASRYPALEARAA